MNHLDYDLATSNETRNTGQVNAHLRFGMGLNGSRGFLKFAMMLDYFNYSTATLKIGNSVVTGLGAGGLRF